jgi:hypothetical protein
MISAVFAITLLWGCEFIPGTASYQEAKARNAVARILIDPSSAQFRSVQVRNNAVCGEVNGKNRMGAYVGFVRFYVEPANWNATLDPQFNPQDLYSARSLCSSLTRYDSSSCTRQIEEEAKQAEQAAFNIFWAGHCTERRPAARQLPFDPTRSGEISDDLMDTNIQVANEMSNQSGSDLSPADRWPLDFDGEPAEPSSNDIQPDSEGPVRNRDPLDQNWLDRAIENSIR